MISLQSPTVSSVEGGFLSAEWVGDFAVPSLMSSHLPGTAQPSPTEDVRDTPSTATRYDTCVRTQVSFCREPPGIPHLACHFRTLGAMSPAKSERGLPLKLFVPRGALRGAQGGFLGHGECGEYPDVWIELPVSSTTVDWEE
jgi:hypothetical protein